MQHNVVFHHISDIHANIHIFLVSVPLSPMVTHIYVYHIFVIFYSTFFVYNMALEFIITI